jgi:beta-lactamase class A
MLKVVKSIFHHLYERISLIPFPIILGVIIISLVVNLIFLGSTVIRNIFSESHRYALLSPRIFADKQNDILINFVDLRKKIQDYVAQTPNQFGIYFEYLPSGISIGVNEKDSYVFASLLKVPIVMAVYKEAEDGKLDLNKTVVIEKADLDNNFGSLWKKGAGTKLTIKDAIIYTLAQSDNTAKNILLRQLHPGSIDDVFKELDIPEDESGNQYVVSPKNYSSTLRSLYLASYITKEDSNEILNILTTSSFDDKLTAGIPNDIKVAHKIGVYEPKTPNDLPVYTDCGIVYVPQRPYILCLMTRSIETDSREYMKDISKMVYDYVTNANNR